MRRFRFILLLAFITFIAFVARPAAAVDIYFTATPGTNVFQFAGWGNGDLPNVVIEGLDKESVVSITLSFYDVHGSLVGADTKIYIPPWSPTYLFVMCAPEFFYTSTYQGFYVNFAGVTYSPTGTTSTIQIDRYYIEQPYPKYRSVDIVFTATQADTVAVLVGDVLFWGDEYNNTFHFGAYTLMSSTTLTLTAGEAVTIHYVIADTLPPLTTFTSFFDAGTEVTKTIDIYMTAFTRLDAKEKEMMNFIFKINGTDDVTLGFGQDATFASFFIKAIVMNKTSALYTYFDWNYPTESYIAGGTLSVHVEIFSNTAHFTILAPMFTNTSVTTTLFMTSIVFTNVISRVNATVLNYFVVYTEKRDPWWLQGWSVTINSSYTFTVGAGYPTGVIQYFSREVEFLYSTTTNYLKYFITKSNDFNFNRGLTDVIDLFGEGTSTTDIVHKAANNTAFSVAFVIIMLGATAAAFIFTRSVSYALYTFYVMSVIASLIGIEFLAALADFGVMKYFIYLFALLLASLAFNIVKKRGGAT